MVVREDERLADRRRGEQLRRLAAAALLINSTLSLDEILQVMTAQAREAIGARRAAARIVLDGSRVLAAAAPPDAAEASAAALDERPVRADGVLTAPLRSRDGAPFGVIELSEKEQGVFDEDDEFVLVQLAQLASAAVENARLVEELRFKSALLEAGHETAIEGVLVVDPDGQILQYNRRFVELWEIPDDVVATRSDDAAIAAVLDKLADPDAFSARISYLYEHPELESRDELRLRDGRVFDRYSAPLRGPEGALHGRVWFFRDVSDRIRAEQELRHRLDELDAVYRMADVVARATSVVEVFDAAMDAIEAGLGARRSSILLFDAAGVMRFRAWRGLSEEYRRAVDGHSPWTPATVDPQPVLVSDAAADPELAPYADVFAREGIAALAFIPLVNRGRLLGKFMVYHDRPHEFAASEIQLAETIARHIATATDRKRDEDRLRFLSEASDVLAASLDVETTLARLGRLAVPTLADYCIVDLVEDDGSLRQVVLAHVEPERDEVLHELRRRYPPEGNPGHPASRAIATGELILFAPVTDDDLRSAAVDDEHLALYRKLDPASYLVVPLVARGRTLGAISFGTGPSGRGYDAADVALAEDLAARAAIAVDNARLFREAQESFARLDTLLVSAPVGIGFWDRDLRYVRVNDALAEINALPAAEHAGKYLHEVVPKMAHALEPLYRRVIETGEPIVHQESTDELAKELGDQRHWLSSYYPVRTPAGETIGVGAVILEITERKQADDRLRFLGEASRLLATSLNVDETLEEVTQLAIEQFADSCSIYAADEGALVRVAFAHRDPERRALAATMPERFAVGAESPFPIVEAYVAQQGVLRPRVPSESYEALRELGVAEAAVEKLKAAPSSLVVAPLLARGENFGVVSFASRSRVFGDGDLELAVEYGRRIAGALDNARLYESERRAADTIRRLQAVTEAGLAHRGLEALLRELVERIRETLDVDTVAILLADGDELVVRAAKGLEEAVELGIRVPIGEGFAGRIAAEQRSMVVEAATTPIVNPVLRDAGLKSLLGAPLVFEGRVIGVVHVGLRSKRPFTERDVQLLELIADRVAMGVDQAVLYEAEIEARRRLGFLAEASTVLASSLDYEATLKAVADLAVMHIADWCAVSMLEPDGSILPLAVAHRDPQLLAWFEEYMRRAPARVDASFGMGKVVRTGEPELIATVPPELVDAAERERPGVREAVERLEARSVMIVPLTVRWSTIGALTFAASGSRRPFDETDLQLAQELARRAGVAIDNARLFREAERRGRAVQALEFIGDGVFLVDRGGLVRIWNPAAEAITGLPADAVVGRPLEEAVPAWATVAPLVPVGTEAPGTRPETVPIEIGSRELWLSISGVAFPDGTVYAFRDLTEEQAVERLKSEFVSTVSHELRTPLAAIYGAAMTLQRADVVLAQEQRDGMLAVVASESERLARIVNDVLWASRLESGVLDVSIESCDVTTIAKAVLDAAAAHAPEPIDLRLTAAPGVPAAAADADKVRQVLVNLVDNAVKYSPEGGTVEVVVEHEPHVVRVSVRDEGLGIPAAEHARIFEKFFRLDPHLTRGVGGTGLGLYICRELVRRMGGRISVASSEGRGSTFSVELPVHSPAQGGRMD